MSREKRGKLGILPRNVKQIVPLVHRIPSNPLISARNLAIFAFLTGQVAKYVGRRRPACGLRVYLFPSIPNQAFAQKSERADIVLESGDDKKAEQTIERISRPYGKHSD